MKLNVSRQLYLNGNKIRYYSSSVTQKSLNNAFDYYDRKYQYLQESVVPTDKFVPSLIRLPIPKLAESCDRYLSSQRPLLSNEAFERTSKIVAVFRDGGIGAKLDAELRAKDKANKHTSYINKPWTDMYLADRRPTTFTHDPGMFFIEDPRPQFRDQSSCAVNHLISTLRLLKSLKENVLYPEVFFMNPKMKTDPSYWNKVRFMPSFAATPLSYLLKAFPLDISQYGNLFQSSRIPDSPKDRISRFPDSRHLCVLKNGHFYTFDVYDENFNLFAPSYYKACMDFIVNNSPKKPPSNIGVLGSQNRDDWAKNKRHLESISPENAKNILAIDSAVYTMCLDTDWTHTEEDLGGTIRNLVLANNPANRWYDKSFNLIFSTNGEVGLRFEHAWGDGVAVLRLVEEMLDDAHANDFVGQDSSKSEANVKLLDIATDDAIKAQVQSATEDYLKKMDSVDFGWRLFDGLGKRLCKSRKIGSDSLMQSIIQIANHRLNGSFVPTYESCSTAIHRHGRTETVRPCTVETSKLAEYFNSGKDIKAEQVLELMRDCSKKHMDLTKMAAQGKGWDRHFFAMKKTAESEGGKLPDIFLDEAFININQIILSTTTLSGNKFKGGGFCPVTPNGYGIGYQIRDDDAGFSVSTYKEHASSDDMMQAIESTSKELLRIISS